jgi:putative nucleotidyltransferase with HDIG domain
MQKAEASLSQVFNILLEGEKSEYIGETISQLEHALQCAQIALDAQSSDELIIAALLHDIGHLQAPAEAKRMDEFGIDHHHRLAGAFLRDLGFSEEVAQLVEGHVEAKRFLVAQKPKYFEELSHASQETLKRQGGPMSDEEATRFQKNPLFKLMLKLRVCDDQAKIPGKKVPELGFYREKVLRHLLRDSL